MRWLQQWFGKKSPATSTTPKPATPAGSATAAPAPAAPIATTSVPVTFSAPHVADPAAGAARALSALAALLRERGHAVGTGDAMLEVEGFALRVVLDGLHNENGIWRSYTQTVASHPQLGDAPIVEFQFGYGDDADQSLRRGFDGWYALDFVVLLDALRETPQHCQFMQWSAGEAKDPATGAPLSACNYRVLFGPIQHFLGDPSRLASGEDPGFCDCCLFTKSLDAFKPLLQEGRLIPARLFVAREADCSTSADCRINGEDYAPVREALQRWAGQWTERGFEWRKQYVIAQPL